MDQDKDPAAGGDYEDSGKLNHEEVSCFYVYVYNQLIVIK